MADKVAIYIKQSDDTSIPVKVRIEWLPDGTIKPSLYWTPDGSCYEIKHIYNKIPLTLLKTRREGLRFKTRAEIRETPEPYRDHRCFQHEAYLYFNHSMFCGRNIIDDRYSHNSKEFITVTLDVFPNCKYELVCFQVQGANYVVEKNIAIEPRASYHAGGIGVWHKVKARQVNQNSGDEYPNMSNTAIRMAALYFEINKWFVITAS